MTTPQVNPILRYIDAEGRLTIEGQKLFQSLLAMMADHEARLTAGGL